MVAGKDAAKPGEGKNSWLTGTAAWNWYTISQFILGIKPDYDGLIVDPCIPEDWKGFKVSRSFRDARYEIDIERTGTYSMAVDGKPVEGRKIPYSKGNHTVKVTL